MSHRKTPPPSRHPLHCRFALARVLGATPLQVEMELLALTTHTPKTVSEEHMDEFYDPWTEIAERKFDGLIVTGAPIEQLPFEDVTYWKEMCRIFEWSRTNVHSLFNLCWGAQAALHHAGGVARGRHGAARHARAHTERPAARGPGGGRAGLPPL